MNTGMISSKKEHWLQKLLIAVLCLYAGSLYIGYINDTLLSLQGLTLYAMVGVLLLVILQRGSIKLNSYTVWYGIFMIFAILSCIYATNRSMAAAGLYPVLIVLIFSVAMAMVITRRAHMEYLFYAMVFGSVILTVYLAVTGKFSDYTDVGDRFGGELTGNANVFASVYMIAAAASVYFMFRMKTARGKLLFLATFISQLYALVVSGGRKYFIFPFILIYLMALQKRDKKSRIHIIRVSILFAALVFAVYMLIMKVEFLYENIGYRFEDLIDYTLDQSTDVEGGTIIRQKMVDRGMELWRSSPILGHGMDMFTAISGFGVYSHNNFVELLCNHGLLGFIWYYGFYIYLLIKLLKNKRNDTLKHFLIGFVAALFVYETGAVAYDTLVTQMFLMFASIYLFLPSEEDAAVAQLPKANAATAEASGEDGKH